MAATRRVRKRAVTKRGQWDKRCAHWQITPREGASRDQSKLIANLYARIQRDDPWKIESVVQTEECKLSVQFKVPVNKWYMNTWLNRRGPNAQRQYFQAAPGQPTSSMVAQDSTHGGSSGSQPGSGDLRSGSKPVHAPVGNTSGEGTEGAPATRTTADVDKGEDRTDAKQPTLLTQADLLIEHFKPSVLLVAKFLNSTDNFEAANAYTQLLTTSRHEWKDLCENATSFARVRSQIALHNSQGH